jgi:hypothetical protein
VDVEAVSALVDQLLPPVLARLQSDDADVSGTMLTQVNNLVRYLQKLHDGSGGLPVPAQEQVRLFLCFPRPHAVSCFQTETPLE